MANNLNIKSYCRSFCGLRCEMIFSGMNLVQVFNFFFHLTQVLLIGQYKITHFTRYNAVKSYCSGCRLNT